MELLQEEKQNTKTDIAEKVGRTKERRCAICGDTRVSPFSDYCFACEEALEMEMGF